jgi:hypothetical protein
MSQDLFRDRSLREAIEGGSLMNRRPSRFPAGKCEFLTFKTCLNDRFQLLNTVLTILQMKTSMSVL